MTEEEYNAQYDSQGEERKTPYVKKNNKKEDNNKNQLIVNNKENDKEKNIINKNKEDEDKKNFVKSKTSSFKIIINCMKKK